MKENREEVFNLNIFVILQTFLVKGSVNFFPQRSILFNEMVGLSEVAVATFTKADYAQILSKREGVLSPYFIQVEQGGAHVKTLFRFSSTYADNGAFGFNQFQWHFLATTFDGERLKTYIDGVLSGSVLKSDPVYVENGDLGIGGSPDGSNLFKGWIDDVRLYKIALNQDDVSSAYGDGFGDFGPFGDFNVSLASSSSPIPGLNTGYPSLL